MTTVERPTDTMHQQYDFMKMNQPETAKNVHVYLNGDQYYPGRKFVINRRYIPDFTGFLNQVTMGIKAPFGAVRNIYTPQAGHRVNDLNQIRAGMQVVAGGVERFRKLDYKEIGARKRPKPKRNYLDIKIRHKMNVAARWRKYVKDPCQIYVYGNGDMNAPALKILLIPRSLNSWDLVLEEITEKIGIKTGRAVRKLYDMEYRLLTDPSELESGQYYVAVGTEKLKKYPYGEIHKQNTPRKIQAHQPLPPIKRAAKSKPPVPIHEDGHKTYTRMYAQKKHHKAQAEEEETTVMGASAATGYRPLKAKMTKPQSQKPSPRGPGGFPSNEPDHVFLGNGKPVKVKRSGGGKAAPPPASIDSHLTYEETDGIYKQKTHEIRAAEVDDAQDIKVDLPIDQIPADVVEEEHIQPQTPLEDLRPQRVNQPLTPPRKGSATGEMTPSKGRSPSRERTPSPISVKAAELSGESPMLVSLHELPPEAHQTGDDHRKSIDAPLTPADLAKSPIGDQGPASPRDDELSNASTGRGVSLIPDSPRDIVSDIAIEVESPTLEETTTATESHPEEVDVRKSSAASRKSDTEPVQRGSVSSQHDTGSPQAKSESIPERHESVASQSETTVPEKKSETLSDHSSVHSRAETGSPERKSDAVPNGKQSVSSRPETASSEIKTETVSSQPKTESCETKPETVQSDGGSVSSRSITESPAVKQETVPSDRGSVSSGHETESLAVKPEEEPVSPPSTHIDASQVDQDASKAMDKTSPTLSAEFSSTIPSPQADSSQHDQSATEETSGSHDDHGPNGKSITSSSTLEESSNRKEESAEAAAFAEPSTTTDEANEHLKPGSSDFTSSKTPEETSETPASTSHEAATLMSSPQNGGVAARPASDTPSVNYDHNGNSTPSKLSGSIKNVPASEVST